jgi:hypothetical protein
METRKQRLQHYKDCISTYHYTKDEKLDLIWKWLQKKEINRKQFKELINCL